MNNPKINIGLLLELMDRDGWTSNAMEYVERAVNSYEIMLNALRKITDPVKGHEDSCGCNCCNGPENIAKQAISKAEAQ